jgi:hypothetical protein
MAPNGIRSFVVRRRIFQARAKRSIARVFFGVSLRISRCIWGWEEGGVEPNRMGRYLKSGRNGHV